MIGEELIIFFYLRSIMRFQEGLEAQSWCNWSSNEINDSG